MKNDQPSISIVIPSYNGAGRLQGLLDSIFSQAEALLEVIVSVDGSQDDSMRLLAEYQVKEPKLQVVFHENQGRADCRNAGAAVALGSHIYFVDDDMQLPAGHVSTLMGRLQQMSPQDILVGLAALPYSPQQNLLSTMRRATEKTANDSAAELYRISWEDYRFTSQLLCIPAEGFKSLGGFSPGLKDSEDFELSIRALEQGVPIWFDKNLHAAHRDHREPQQYAQRKLEYWLARRRLGIEYPDYVLAYPEHFPAEEIPTWKKQLLPFFRLNWFWNWAFESKWLSNVVPQRILFPILNRVIYSTARHQFEQR